MSTCSFTSKYSYAVGIPTKDRSDILKECLLAFDKSTIVPEVIVVVNNNLANKPISLPPLVTKVIILENPHAVKGISQGNAVAFDWIKKNGFTLAAKWDDDLIPTPTCMEKLLQWSSQFSVVGGCYPRPNSPAWKDGPRSSQKAPDGFTTHLQFFRWFEEGQVPPKPLKVGALYSSYIYSVKRMEEVGGFNLWHSPIGYREDTDLTSRMGNCLIEPAAIAIHHVQSGGNRGFDAEISESMRLHDQILFFKNRNKAVNFESYFKTEELEA